MTAYYHIWKFKGWRVERVGVEEAVEGRGPVEKGGVASRGLG